MLSNLQQQFNEFIIRQESLQAANKYQQLSSDRLYELLLNKYEDEYDQQSVFGQEFFKTNLRKIAQTIMNVVFRTQVPFIKIDQLVVFISILQHIFYDKMFDLPPNILKRVQSYTCYLLVMQNLETIRGIFEDMHGSAVISHFYNKVYKEAFCFRIRQVSLEYGLKINKFELPLYFLQCIVEQKQGNLQNFDSKVTSQWISLALVYFVLSMKGDFYKQKPIFAKILKKYKCLKYECDTRREINGDQLCEFYNTVFLGLARKIEEKQMERLVDDIKHDIDVSSQYLLNPIVNENNTVLDNIVFSSSWEM